MNSNLREILRCCSLLTIVLGNHKGFLALVLLEQQFSASESAPFPCFLEGEVELVESDAFATLLIPEGEGAEAGGGDMNDKDKFSLIPAQSLSFTSPPPAKADLLILPHPAFHQHKHILFQSCFFLPSTLGELLSLTTNCTSGGSYLNPEQGSHIFLMNLIIILFSKCCCAFNLSYCSSTTFWNCDNAFFFT